MMLGCRAAALAVRVLSLARFTGVLFLAGFLAGCSSYTQRSVQIRDALARDQFDKAIEHIEQINKGNSELLYLYELGTILHSQGRYTESNEVLERAELLFDDLYTRSVTREAAALALADQAAKYRGDAFETVYVNYYKMLNYWYLGEEDGALVEARRLNNKIQFLPDVDDSVFVDNPFLQWVTGMMYEEDRERSSADVSYRNAFSAYETLQPALGIAPPAPLACDLVANALALGDRELASRYEDRCSLRNVLDTRPKEARSNVSHVTLFLECGYVAGKVSREIVIPIYKGETDGDDFVATSFANDLVLRVGEPRRRAKLDYVLKLALPDLVRPPSRYGRAHIRATSDADTLSRDLVLADDLNVWAGNAFKARFPKILFRTVLRGLMKYLAKKEAGEENEALGWLVNIVGAATEVADTRTWSTLPERIFVTHLTLPEGSWRLEVEVLDPMGQRVAWLEVPELLVGTGERRFLNYRVH